MSLTGRNLDAPGIAADPALSGLLRNSCCAIARAVRTKRQS
ncbi:MAG: hypothetical protein ABIQ65_09655 [Thermoanaerobaculia bacterium]